MIVHNQPPNEPTHTYTPPPTINMNDPPAPTSFTWSIEPGKIFYYEPTLSPSQPWKTDAIQTGLPINAFTLPIPLRLGKPQAVNANSGERYYSNSDSLQWKDWILRSIGGCLMEIKNHIVASFLGMALPLGLVAWCQIRYSQYL